MENQLACLPSLKPLLNLILYGSVYPRSWHGSYDSSAQTIQEIAEAAKRRRHHQHRDASIPGAFLFATMDPHTFEQLSEVGTGSVHECTAGGIEMEGYGESSKGSHPDETKHPDGT